ncbi:MAG: ABC transporter permease [Micrococcales bacterium]|nr:ABC transporter permease [Micrococcales bacterium]
MTTTVLDAPRVNLPVLGRELSAVVAVTARDVTITLKSPGTMIMGLAMPLMMMGLIGGNLMANMTGGIEFDFGEFMLVGMLVNMLFMMTTMGVTTLIDDTEANFSAEMLVAPVSRYSIIIGKILGSAFMAMVSSLGVLAVGLVMGITLTPWQLLVLFALAPGMCLAGGSLAVIVMGVIKSKKTANMVVMLITMPQMFLSGVIIPIASSTGVLFVLARILPMTYCVDLARAVVYSGTPTYSQVVLFHPAVSLAVVGSLTVVFLVIGTYLYARSEKDR